MGKIRKPAVAGTFYPDDESQLKKLILNYLRSDKPGPNPPKAVIVPHAGYIYSGSIAGTAYDLIARTCKYVRRVVLIGPSHFVPISGIALSTADAFETPLGNIPIDKKAYQKITEEDGVLYSDQAHKEEHSLEVQLPFLQMVLGDFTLVPLAVGCIEEEKVANVLELLWGGPETLIVVSSDLSHFSNYEVAKKIDQVTAQAIETLKPENVQHSEACGAYGIRGFLKAAQAHHMKAETLDLRNSGDTAGDKDRVVGYGSFAFNERITYGAPQSG
jgi:hypothetical protein